MGYKRVKHINLSHWHTVYSYIIEIYWTDFRKVENCIPPLYGVSTTAKQHKTWISLNHSNISNHMIFHIYKPQLQFSVDKNHCFSNFSSSPKGRFSDFPHVQVDGSNHAARSSCSANLLPCKFQVPRAVKMLVQMLKVESKDTERTF